MPKLVKSLPSIQVVKRRKQLIVSPELPPIKDVIEVAKIPRLGNATNADDDPFEMEENLHPSPFVLEDDGLERDRSQLDDVPLHIKGGRRAVTSTNPRPISGDGADDRRRWKDGGKSSPIRKCVERLLGRQVKRVEDTWWENDASHVGVPPTKILPHQPSGERVEPEIRSSWTRGARIAQKVVFIGSDHGEVEPCFVISWMKNCISWIHLQDW